MRTVSAKDTRQTDGHIENKERVYETTLHSRSKPKHLVLSLVQPDDCVPLVRMSTSDAGV